MKMRKLVALLLAVLFSALYLAACSNSGSLDISRDGSGDSASEPDTSAESNDSLPSNGEYLVDARDGQRYRTVTIGGYTWMAENLNYETDSSTCFDDPDFYGLVDLSIACICQRAILAVIFRFCLAGNGSLLYWRVILLTAYMAMFAIVAATIQYHLVIIITKVHVIIFTGQ